MKKPKLELIPEAKKAHKYWSNRFNLLTFFLAVCELIDTFYTLLPFWEGVIPDHIFIKLIPLTTALAYTSRYFRQRLDKNEPDQSD